MKRNKIFFCVLFMLQLHAHDLEQRPLVVIIPSYNNAQWCKANIESVFQQNYENYRIIFIDDCSSDDTGSMVTKLVVEHNQQHRVQLIRNLQRRGALANIYSAIHSCADHEIIIMLDGDDWLAHEKVFARVNEQYQQDIWLTYGQFKAYPDGRIGECKEYNKAVVQHNFLREWDWVASHLRTFYAGLFKKIALTDLLYQENFFDVTWDMALMFPMLEMAGGKFSFIPDVLYIYNCAHANNDFKTKFARQIHCDKVVRSRKKYTPLHHAPYKTDFAAAAAALLILAENSSVSLSSFIEQAEKTISGLESITVLYQGLSLKKEIVQFLEHCSCDYVLVAGDNLVLDEGFACTSCIKALQQTKAQAFHTCLGCNTVCQCSELERACAKPSLVMIDHDLYAWHYAVCEYAWRAHNDIQLVMYEKNYLKRAVTDIRFTSLEQLKNRLKQSYSDSQEMGLCFEKAKAHELNKGAENR